MFNWISLFFRKFSHANVDMRQFIWNLNLVILRDFWQNREDELYFLILDDEC